MNRKYMILCVAGQSNAVGYDESSVPKDYCAYFDASRIHQLGLYGAENLKIIPLGACAQSFQDLRPFSHPDSPGIGTKGIHLPLSGLLLPMIPPDYDLLVLSCAYGGTGFTVGQYGPYDEAALRPEPGVWRWGVSSNYYRAMKARIAYALDLHPDNRFLGVVWCQGEHDHADADGQRLGFEAMTQDFFRFFSSRYPQRVFRGDWNRDVWYTYETTGYWYTQGQCAAIWENYRRWNPATYIPIPRDTPTNELRGTGSTARIRAAHFGADAFLNVIAPRTAEAFAHRLLEEDDKMPDQ